MNRDSHRVSFGLPDLLRFAGTQGLSLCVVVGIVVCLGELDWLPRARAVQSTDEVLFAQRVAVAAESTAGIILTGDSSCAVGVDARQLQMRLPGHPEVVNQGLLMGLPMSIYAGTAAPIVTRRGEQPTVVVLLFTPESLTGSSFSPLHVDLWQRLIEGRAGFDRGVSQTWTALETGRARLVRPLFPWVLHGRASLYLPHVLHAGRYLGEHQGSLVDRGWFNRVAPWSPQEMQIQARQLQESGAIRALLGDQAMLVAGLTPVPESMADAGFQQRRDQLLRQWNETLHADLLLTNLPARFPNGYCASAVHLNQRGQEQFTRLLAIELANQPPVHHEKK